MRGKLFVVAICGAMVLTALLCALPQGSSPSQQKPYGGTPPGSLGVVLDTDQDGVLDVDETAMGLNPQNPDSDGDGMRDGAEVAFWNNQTASHAGQPVPSWVRARHPGATQYQLSQQWGPAGDLDGDGRPNINDSDADSDGIRDGVEVQRGLDLANPDSDQDGVLDGRDPNPLVNTDSDRDGMADDWETVNAVADPNADTDLDGVPNIQEFQAGTDPNSEFRPGNELFNFASGQLALQGFESFYGTGSLTEAVFRVQPITNPRYWRLQTYKDYNGRVWTGAASTAYTAYNGKLTDQSDVLLAPMVNNGESYRITVNGTLTGLLPTAAHTTAVSYVEPRGQPIAVGPGPAFRTTGSVSAYNLTADLENFGDRLGSARPDASRSGYLSTPYGASSRVKVLARNITAGIDDTNGRLEAIALWLRDNCRFDRSAPPPSSGEDPVDHFLFDSNAGISPDFSSAYVLLCRLNGIPARLADGFAPGVIRGDARYVQLGHRHCWAEVALDGIGWVGVECTPENAEPGHGIALGSSGIDTNILQFWDTGIGSWWYYDNRPANVGGNGGGSVSGGFFVVINSSAPANDSDGDGLNNTDEMAAGTNPYSADTDGDGIDDARERQNHWNPRSDDADGDGLTDAQELAFGSDPNKRDTDGGGACDHQEYDWKTNPRNPADDHPAVDFDNDHINDWDERAAGRDPRSVDTDRDGLTDPDEISRGTDLSAGDSDHDGLTDLYETERGTSPTNADTDGDGLDDWLEVSQGIDPLNRDTDGDGLDDATEYYDHDLDPRVFDQDRDGLSDSQERARGTDPQNLDTNGDGIRDGQSTTGAGGSSAPTTRSDATWAMLAGVLVVVALGAAYAFWSRRHVDELQDTLRRAEHDLTNLDIDTEPDEVRRVIYRTYKELCGTLQKYGFLRGKANTLREFEHAVEEALALDGRSLSELTGIVEEARYSDHTLGQGYKERALGCIRGILGSLELRAAGRRKGKAAA
jgi:transglutaminase-like putative cysteine protease